MKSLKRLITYSKPFRADLWLATSYSILNKIFDILPEVLIGVAVDIVVKRKESFVAKLGIVDVFSQLVALGMVTLAAFVCESVLQYAYQVKWRNLAQVLQHAMRLDTYSHVQKLDMAYFDDKSTGSLMSVINDDINQLERFLDGGANALIQVIASTLIIGAIFFWLSPMVAMVALLPMPIILFGAYWFQDRLGPRYALVRARAGQISDRLANNLLGMPTIRSYAKESFETNRVAKDSLSYLDANSAAITLSSAFIPVIRMAIVAGFIATLILGGYATITGELAVASYSVLVFLTQRLLWPFTRLAEMTDLYQRAMASCDRVLDLLRTPVSIADGGERLRDVKGMIEFSDVSFEYANGTKVLSDFNLAIKQGQTVAFVGATGAGKSTLIKLLMRFYSQTSGDILLDGHDISLLKLEDLRNAISFVSQDVFLFPGSIKDNIAYGRPDATNQAIINAAIVAGAHAFIMDLPQNYDTEVGERGLKLSGGQKQRLSIARAVLKNSPIFIFDEATSAVDNETEEAIQRSLSQIVQNRTTIIIAHRLSTIRHADAIYVLDHGSIVESGRHDDLVRMNGIYAKLWQIQTGEI